MQLELKGPRSYVKVSTPDNSGVAQKRVLVIQGLNRCISDNLSDNLGTTRMSMLIIQRLKDDD